MAISQSPPVAKRSPFHSASKRKALEAKKKLFCKKQANQNHITKKVRGAGDSKKAIVRYKKANGDDDSFEKAKAAAMVRAQEVQANLPSKFPCFLKPMLPSHVTGGFWLSYPKSFCDMHLPKHDDSVVLVDEDGKEYETKYLVDKNGLSGGWRGFSISHNLLEGDVLVFQLIDFCKFKVYIVRVYGLNEIDGAIGLLTLDSHAKSLDFVNDDPTPLNICQEIIQEEDNDSELLQGIRFSETPLDFKNVKCFDDFNILVDGLIIDSEVSKHLRNKYYELCRCRNMFLHDRLVSGLNSKLAAGIISETINIADAIRASKITTPIEDLETWDKTLGAFEDLGMVVGFLRERVGRLVGFLCERRRRERVEAKRVERERAEEEMRCLKRKVAEVTERIRVLDGEIEGLSVDEERVEVLFKEEANAPW